MEKSLGCKSSIILRIKMNPQEQSYFTAIDISPVVVYTLNQ